MRNLCVILCWALALVPLLGTDEPAPVAYTDVPVPALSERLAALHPDDPEGYLVLGELVASEGDAPPARELARHLLVLAHERERALGQTRGVRTSAALALARLAGSADERRWLVALARAQQAPGQYIAPPIEPVPRGEDLARLSVDIGSAFSLARTGYGRRAEEIHKKPVIAAALRAIEPGFARAGISAQRLVRLAQQHGVCPECENRRTINRAGVREVCPSCDGTPGPKLAPSEVLAELRIESALLHATRLTWSAHLNLGGSRPLRELEPEDLAPAYKIDPDACIYREGRWVKP